MVLKPGLKVQIWIVGCMVYDLYTRTNKFDFQMFWDFGGSDFRFPL